MQLSCSGYCFAGIHTKIIVTAYVNEPYSSIVLINFPCVTGGKWCRFLILVEAHSAFFSYLNMPCWNFILHSIMYMYINAILPNLHVGVN